MTDKTKSILITGFEPFGEHKNNISQDIARRFVNKKTTFTQNDCTYELTWQAQILSVDEKGSTHVAETIERAPCPFDAIIQCGLCEKCEHIHIERRAQNILNMRVADNAERYLQNQVIIPDAPPQLFTSVDAEALDLEPFPRAQISNDAGAYVCNETYFRSLWALKKTKQVIPLIFLHLPSVERFNLYEQCKYVEDLARQCILPGKHLLLS